jgi:hypothetical protein
MGVFPGSGDSPPIPAVGGRRVFIRSAGLIICEWRWSASAGDHHRFFDGGPIHFDASYDQPVLGCPDDLAYKANPQGQDIHQE